MGFQTASKKNSKLRLAIFGPSGSGKTYTALRIAKGLGGKIAVIDTERGSACKYVSDEITFDVSELENPQIDNYIRNIEEAFGYDVLIIDSLSHGWKELLEEVDRIAKAKYRGNTWSAWSHATPKQNQLVNAILSFPGHVIATMRVKTEWLTESDGKGKIKPVRVGLAPEQRHDTSYEFDLLLELSTDHIGNVIKDRTGKFQDKLIDKPGEAFGKELANWLNEGVEDKNPKVSISKKSSKAKEKLVPTNVADLSLFPVTSILHQSLNDLLLKHKADFSDSHFNWIIQQVTNDNSEASVEKMIGHVNQVCQTTGKKAI